jgi:AcrR family transcriptional regulator
VEPSLIAAHPQVEPLLAESRDGAGRARVLEAIAQVVADKGYAATTVADVCRAARVSRGTFYEQFGGKEDAFLEAYRHGIDVLQGRVRAAVRDEDGDWIARLRAGLRAYVETLTQEPRFARTYMLEIHAAGPRAQAARDEALRRFARRYRASFEAGSRGRRGGRAPSDAALFVLAAGVDQLVAARVREHGAAGLRGLEGELTDIAVSFLEGAATVPLDDDNRSS